MRRRALLIIAAATLAACRGTPEPPEAPGATTGAVDVRAVATLVERPLADSAAALGERTYVVCATCHQQDGQGVPTAFPPLAGSEWVAGPAEVPIRIVLHGLHGPITVKHEPYVGTMAPLGALLDDRQIAAVLTYVRSSWGNRAGPVTEAEVAAVRAASAARGGTPYRAAELEGMLKGK